MNGKDCSSHSFMHIATILLWVLIWAWVAVDMYTLRKKEAETASDNAKVMTRMLEEYILTAPDRNDPHLLENFARTFYLPPHTTLFLINDEQKLIAQFPPNPGQIGMQLSSGHPIFASLCAGQSEGSISWESLIDDVKRLYYCRSMQDAYHPFIIALGQERSWVFRAWYQRAMAYAVLCTLVTLISLLSLKGWRTRIKHMAKITQRLIRDMEEKSRENKTLLDFIPDPAWMIDAEDNIVAANRAFLSFFQRKEAGVLGRSFSEIVTPENHEILAKGHWSILETKTAGLQTMWLTGADEQPHPFEISRVPLFNEAGQLYRIVGIARDLTSRYEAESRQQVISQILDHNSDGLMLLDKDLRIMIANQALRHLTGYSEKELVGHFPDEFLSTQLDRRIIRSLIWQMKHSGAWNSEIRILDKKGAEKPFLCRIASITNEQSRTKNWIVFLNDLSRHHETEERIKRLITIDSLTGLPNRKGFLDSLDENLDSYSVDALMVLNLNHMSRINDVYGHQAGDFLLQRVASRIRKTLRDHDVVGRLGDDNFGIQLVSSNLKNIEQIIKKIMAVIARPILIKEQPIICTACVGVCLVSGSHQRASDLLRKADTAMRQAREAGVSTYRFFSENLGKTLVQRVKRETDLRSALGRRELALYYQPQIDITSGRICGCEALLRWNHPQQGLIPPLEFIQLAEETGLILPIGKWVLEEACRQNKAWQDKGHPPVIMAVNLSSVQLRHELLLEHVSSALEQSGLESRWLELEITESVLLSEQMNSVLQALKALGVGLSIDDFGTGYSSLAYLRHFPFNKLKIDRSFIRDLNTNSGAAIVRMVLDMAHELSLKTLAEGVETEEQINILTDYQCMEYQGYLCSKPIPATSFMHLLQRIKPANVA
jgi:diguanylate cyclase (GGDEF)-like protein/PAS domain S-box-containing protein